MVFEICSAVCINAFFYWNSDNLHWNLGEFAESMVSAYPRITEIIPFGNESNNIRVVISKTKNVDNCATVLIKVQKIKDEKDISAKSGSLLIRNMCMDKKNMLEL